MVQIWRRAGRQEKLVAGLVLGSWLVIAITGVWLWLYYRPTVAAAWPELDPELVGEDGRSVMESVHLGAAVFGLALPAAYLLGMQLRRMRPIPMGTSVSAIGVLIAGLGLLTGYQLRWDQIALNAVQVGTGLRGMGAASGESVRFVLVNGQEVSPDRFRLVAIGHAALAPLAVALVAVEARRIRKWWARRDARSVIEEEAPHDGLPAPGRRR